MTDKPEIKETKTGYFEIAKLILNLPFAKLFLVLAFFSICIFAYLKFELIQKGYNSIMNPEPDVRSVFVPDTLKTEQLEIPKAKE